MRFSGAGACPLWAVKLDPDVDKHPPHLSAVKVRAGARGLGLSWVRDTENGHAVPGEGRAVILWGPTGWGLVLAGLGGELG